MDEFPEVQTNALLLVILGVANTMVYEADMVLWTMNMADGLIPEDYEYVAEAFASAKDHLGAAKRKLEKRLTIRRLYDEEE